MFLSLYDFYDIEPVKKQDNLDQIKNNIPNVNPNVNPNANPNAFSKTFQTFNNFIVAFYNKHPITLQNILISSYNPFDPFNLKNRD